MRSANVAPDLSSSSARVSEIVSTAIFSGTNCLVVSMPGMLDYNSRLPGAWRVARIERSEMREVSRLPAPDFAALNPGYTSISKLRGGKGVAACDRAGAEAGIEPALALLGGAVREGVRNRVAARPPLQRVIADRRRGAQRGLDVA